MPLKIIGAGFGRTGTMSLRLALNQMGFACYHLFAELRENTKRPNLDFWRRVANAPEGSQHEWEKAFANYTASVDNPGCCVWRELAIAYPDAKVILTIHPKGAEAWYESTRDTSYRFSSGDNWQFRVLEIATPLGRQIGDISRKLVWGRSLGDAMPQRDKVIARYERHIELVKATIPEDRLLIFSVDQGWGPLCSFLRTNAPPGEFPHVNAHAESLDAVAALMKQEMGSLDPNVIFQSSNEKDLLETVKKALPRINWEKEYEDFLTARRNRR